MHTFLISDLHLNPKHPQIIQAYAKFLATEAITAERLYCLGDLFEYWIGDDAASLVGADPIIAAMQQVSQHVDCYFIAGNRDFMVGEQFALQSGFQILPDETVIDLYGEPTLLLHGDSLCTDDIAHMQFRAEVVMNADRKREFMSLPIPARIAQAQAARSESAQHKSEISMEIMDVTPTAVEDAFIRHNVKQMIHGHTHRQNTHHYKIAGADHVRYVLGDWHQTASIMKADQKGIEISNPAI